MQSLNVTVSLANGVGFFMGSGHKGAQHMFAAQKYIGQVAEIPAVRILGCWSK